MSDIRFDVLGPGDYDRAKAVLDRAKHPGFVGREIFFRCATTGQAIVAVLGEADVGVALIVKGKLQALSVIVTAQGHGVGGRLVDHTRPEWVNAIMDRVPWFKKRGYKEVGAPKVGQSGKMAVQLMQRDPDHVATPGAPVAGAAIESAIAKEKTPPVTPSPAAPAEPYDPDNAPLEDPDQILNSALRCMRMHLAAIETGGASGRLLVLDQPTEIAGFVRALGAVSTKRKKKVDDELGNKSLEELFAEAMKSPTLRPLMASAFGKTETP